MPVDWIQVMEIVRFTAGKRTRYGILGSDSIQVIIGSPFRSVRSVEERYRLSDVRLLAPWLPSKKVAVGLNYRSHAEELGTLLPAAPLIFL